MKWRYFKWGTCFTCDNADVRLYKPAPETEGLHVVQFEPLCFKCANKQDSAFERLQYIPPQEHICTWKVLNEEENVKQCTECKKIEYKNKFT